MKQHQMLMIASIGAVLLALAIVFRAVSAKTRFDDAVRESLKTTEGYDQRFIDRVNRLEELLATRAQFGYSGGKDPMTGTTRQVVKPAAPAGKPGRSKPQKAEAAPVVAEAAAAVELPAVVDRVKLTAIIGDAAGGKFTAVIMDGERSFSVDPEDVVAGRKITRITNEGIYMESDTVMYFYDIYGNVVKKNRAGRSVAPAENEEQQSPEPSPKKPEPSPEGKRQVTKQRGK